jgi:methyl coenzyme M reductase beta subunit
MMARRFVIRIELTQSAKSKLTDLSDQNGMTQVSIMSRLVEWFTAQPEIIQAAVLGRYPKSVEEDVAKLILRRMAGEMS